MPRVWTEVRTEDVTYIFHHGRHEVRHIHRDHDAKYERNLVSNDSITDLRGIQETYDACTKEVKR